MSVKNEICGSVKILNHFYVMKEIISFTVSFWGSKVPFSDICPKYTKLFRTHFSIYGFSSTNKRYIYT